MPVAPAAIYLGMQAAGMILDFFGTSNQAEENENAAQIQKMQYEENLYQTRLEAEDNSLQALKRLRQNLGSQIAVFAARGTRSNAGSALSFMNESISNFNSDERMRRLNLLGKEGQLRTSALISQLKSESEQNRLWQGFATRTINSFPSTYEGWKTYGKTVKEAFGLTNIDK